MGAKPAVSSLFLVMIQPSAPTTVPSATSLLSQRTRTTLRLGAATTSWKAASMRGFSLKPVILSSRLGCGRFGEEGNVWADDVHVTALRRNVETRSLKGRRRRR